MIHRKKNDLLYKAVTCLCHSLWQGEFTCEQVVNRPKIPQGLSTLLFRRWSEVPSRGGVSGDSPYKKNKKQKKKLQKNTQKNDHLYASCLCHSLWHADFTCNRRQVVNRLKIPQGLSTLLFRRLSEVPPTGGVRCDSLKKITNKKQLKNNYATCSCHRLWQGEFTREQVVNRLKIPQGLSTLMFRRWSEVPSRGGVRGDSP